MAASVLVLAATSYPPPPFLQPPPPSLPPEPPPPPYPPPPPLPPIAPFPPTPKFPPQSRFGTLYGGYDTLADLLEELTRFEHVLDPDKCNLAELGTYCAWLAISLLLMAVGYCLQRRRPGQHLLFRMTIVAPAVVYAVVFLGFMGACLDTGATQEESFCITLIAIEPLVCLYLVYLLRDAARGGLSARVFDLPLRQAEWRWLGFCLFFHLSLLLLAVVLLIQATGPGRLLL